jgi:hypothetical protein
MRVMDSRGTYSLLCTMKDWGVHVSKVVPSVLLTVKKNPITGLERP